MVYAKDAAYTNDATEIWDEYGKLQDGLRYYRGPDCDWVRTDEKRSRQVLSAAGDIQWSKEHGTDRS